VTGPESTKPESETTDAEKESPAVPVDTETPKDAEVTDDAEITEPTEADSDELTDTAQADAADEDLDDDLDDEDLDDDDLEDDAESTGSVQWMRVLAYGILPGLALVLAMAAGFLKFQDSSVRDADVARIESVQAAKDSTIKMLSYKAETVDKDLTSAEDLLTGTFRDSYAQLIHDVVIPGAKEKKITAVATVPAVASVSATDTHAVVLVFVNQSVVVGATPPTDTASSVRVTLDKVGDRWLVSQFEPV
jgi:Mce-associated membrane protein